MPELTKPKCWMDDIVISDLPEIYQEMAEIIGVQNTIKLAQYYEKQNFYFPSISYVVRKKKHDFIKKYYSGKNLGSISRIVGYSKSYTLVLTKKLTKL